MNYCTLPADINQCKYFVPDGEGACSRNSAKCTFFQYKENNGSKGYVRKPRWYEKYYKY